VPVLHYTIHIVQRVSLHTTSGGLNVPKRWEDRLAILFDFISGRQVDGTIEEYQR